MKSFVQRRAKERLKIERIERKSKRDSEREKEREEERELDVSLPVTTVREKERHGERREVSLSVGTLQFLSFSKAQPT